MFHISGFYEKVIKVKADVAAILNSFRRTVLAVRVLKVPSASGGYTRGRQPLLWGEPAASMRANGFLLARSVPPAWGEPTPPRLAPGGNGKGGLNSLLPQAISLVPLP